MTRHRFIQKQQRHIARCDLWLLGAETMPLLKRPSTLTIIILAIVIALADAATESPPQPENTTWQRVRLVSRANYLFVVGKANRCTGAVSHARNARWQAMRNNFPAARAALANARQSLKRCYWRKDKR